MTTTTHYRLTEAAPRTCGATSAADSATTDPNHVACPDCLDRMNGYDGHTPALVHWGTRTHSTRTLPTASSSPTTTRPAAPESARSP